MSVVIVKVKNIGKVIHSILSVTYILLSSLYLILRFVTNIVFKSSYQNMQTMAFLVSYI